LIEIIKIRYYLWCFHNLDRLVSKQRSQIKNIGIFVWKEIDHSVVCNACINSYEH
jgi:hypothetical protein